MTGTDEQVKTKGTKPMKHTLTLLTALLLASLTAFADVLACHRQHLRD
jgi:hypothetical protein